MGLVLAFEIGAAAVQARIYGGCPKLCGDSRNEGFKR
jgi:hypothetical protein